MTTSDLNISYHDLNSLNELRATAKTNQEEGIRQAARQFESVFMGMLLSSMRKANANFEDDNPMNSQTTGFYRDMYDSQLSTELSKSGSLGLAELMVKQLAPQYHKADDLNASLHKHKLHPKSEAYALPVAGKGKALPASTHDTKVMKLDIEHVVHAKQQHVQARRFEEGAQQLPAEQLQQVKGQATESTQFLAAEQVVAAKNSQQQRQATPMSADIQTKESESLQLSLDGSASQQQFIRSMLPAAQKAAAVLGLEPVALIAQAALETGWGTKQLADGNGRTAFNLFGIKAQGDWRGDAATAETIEYRQGVAQKEQAKFRVYANVEQSVQDYVQFIQQNPRYQGALAVTAEPQAYFRQLQAAGYATDPNYARKVVAVMQSPILQQLRSQLASQQG